MTPEEIGIAFNQLVARRALYSFPLQGRRRTQEEKDAVEILERQFGRTRDLEEFLGTQGLRLHILDAAGLGLAPAGNVYVAVRDPLRPAAPHLSPEDVLQELADERRVANADAAAIWGTFMLLTAFYFLYTRDDRPIEAVSLFKDSSIEFDEFHDEVQKRIEQLRIEGEPADSQARYCHEILTSLPDSGVETRVRTFFNSLIRVGVLELAPRDTSSKKEVYRQSLWSAVDVANNFRRHAGTLALSGLPDVVAIVTPEVERTPGALED